MRARRQRTRGSLEIPAATRIIASSVYLSDVWARSPQCGRTNGTSIDFHGERCPRPKRHPDNRWRPPQCGRTNGTSIDFHGDALDGGTAHRVSSPTTNVQRPAFREIGTAHV